LSLLQARSLLSLVMPQPRYLSRPMLVVRLMLDSMLLGDLLQLQPLRLVRPMLCLTEWSFLLSFVLFSHFTCASPLPSPVISIGWHRCRSFPLQELLLLLICLFLQHTTMNMKFNQVMRVGQLSTALSGR